MSYPNQIAAFAMATDDLRRIDRKVSHQRLVKDEVLFKQGRDRDAELREALKKMESSFSPAKPVPEKVG